MKRFLLLLVLAGCSVVDDPYPLAWDPLPAAPAPDCRRFEGTYSDRGQAPGQTARPSLTRALFGESGPWEKASSITLLYTGENELEVRVAAEGQPPVVRRLSAKDGEFRCDRGRLVLRSTRWVASDVLSGRESVKIELHEADPFLVAHVYESMTGVIFVLVPLSGESARWFRFPRLKS